MLNKTSVADYVLFQLLEVSMGIKNFNEIAYLHFRTDLFYPSCKSSYCVLTGAGGGGGEGKFSYDSHLFGPHC